MSGAEWYKLDRGSDERVLEQQSKMESLSNHIDPVTAGTEAGYIYVFFF